MRQRRGRTLAVIRLLGYVALAALAFLLLQRTAMVLAPLFTGMFLAWLLNPAVLRLGQRGLPRPLAIVVLLVGFGAMVAAVVLVLPPLLSREIDGFISRFSESVQHLETVILPWLRATLHLPRSTSSGETVRQALANLNDALQGARGDLSSAVAGAMSTARGLLQLLLAVILTPVFTIYFLSDYPALRTSLDDLIPPRHREQVVGMLDEINHALASWARGQLTVMVILGTLYATGLSLTHVPLGMAIGLATGLMAFVPYIGVAIGFCFAMAAALLEPSPAGAILGVVATYGAVQSLDAFFITPRVLGGRVGLSPVAVIFALSLGGQLLGYAGVVLAVPTAAVCKVLLQHARRWYFATPFYTGDPAVLTDEEAAAIEPPRSSTG